MLARCSTKPTVAQGLVQVEALMLVGTSTAGLKFLREAAAWLSQVWGFGGIAAGNAPILEAGDLLRRAGPEGV